MRECKRENDTVRLVFYKRSYGNRRRKDERNSKKRGEASKEALR